MSRKAMAEVGDVRLKLLENYPACSQDLNPVETVWRELRARLAETEPQKMETRKEFLRRLDNAVRWCGRHHAKHFLNMCQDQEKRAKDYQKMTPPGSRTAN